MKKIYGIDHVYIICNKRHERQRYKYLLNLFSKVFPPDYYTFYTYCYRDTLTDDDIQEYNFNVDKLTKSEISLCINHFKILESAYEKYNLYNLLEQHDEKDNTVFQNILILESDVIAKDNWVQNFEIVMNKLIKKDPNFYFVHVGDGNCDNYTPDKIYNYTLSQEPDVYNARSCRCAESIVWSFSGICKFLPKKNMSIEYPYDIYLNSVSGNLLTSSKLSESNIHWSHPCIFRQGSNNEYKSSLRDTNNKLITHNLDMTEHKINQKLPILNIKFSQDVLFIKDFLITQIQQNYYNKREVTSSSFLYPAHVLVTSSINDKEIDENKYLQSIILVSANCSEMFRYYGTKYKNTHIIYISTEPVFSSNILFYPDIVYSDFLYNINLLVDIDRSFNLLQSKKFCLIKNSELLYTHYNEQERNYINTLVNRLNEINNIYNSKQEHGNYLFELVVDYKNFNISDRILHCYFTGRIPIFVGNKVAVETFFNRDTFISVNDYENSIDVLINKLNRLYNNKHLCESFYKNPIFENNSIHKLLNWWTNKILTF